MGSSSTCNSGQQGGAEECLVSQECIVLPQTGALVYPLTASGQLVGLLVVDSAQSISMGTSSMTASTSSSLGLVGLGSSCSSTATSIQSHQYQQKQNQQQQSQQQQHQQLGGLLPAPHPDAGMLVPPGMSFESGAGSDGSPMGHMLKLDGEAAWLTLASHCCKDVPAMLLSAALCHSLSASRYPYLVKVLRGMLLSVTVRPPAVLLYCPN